MADHESLARSPVDANMAKLVYALYLLGFVLGGVTNLIGLIVAYVCLGDARQWVKTHFQLQIRTFWIGLLYSAVGIIAVWFDIYLVGAAILFLTFIWTVVRCVIGLKAALEMSPYPRPDSWLW
ncbi:DUF4870 family protein [Dongia sp.]|uniref:DUF4870 family protein n=1 Tax=Dongia sp. TaxID=1977262 RepID=UPI003750C013